jgi:hypothetical protein
MSIELDYTDPIWNLLHMLSLTVLDIEPKNVKTNLDLFVSFLRQLHELISTSEYYDVSSIYECSTPIALFEWVYSLRKRNQVSYMDLESCKSYYFPIHKNEHPSGLLTKNVWGPYTWTVIHYITKKFTNKEKVSSFLLSLYKILPCEICRNHAQEYLAEHPVTKDTFSWSVEFHNQVSLRLNQTNGTRKKIYQLQEVNEWYK